MNDEVMHEEIVNEPIDEPEEADPAFLDLDGNFNGDPIETPPSLDSKTEQNRTGIRGKDMDVEGKFVYLDVGEIILPDASNVRMWSDKNPTAAETARIEALARTIKDKGQIQPIRVMERQLDGGGVQYELITGRRRVAAIASMEVPRKVEAIVVGERDVETVRHEAIIENVQREDINPIDFMYLIKDTRERLKLKGAKNTPKLAEYFGVSPAKIHTYEKFEELDEETKAKVHEGEISREGAFLLVGRENAGELVKKAKEYQEEEERKKPGKSKSKANGKVDGKAEAGTKAVKARSLKKAIRETDTNKVIARSGKDVMDWFESMRGPVYGYEDGAVHQFLDSLASYKAGSVGDRALEKRWAVMVEKAFKGTAPKSESKKGDSEVKVKSKPRQKK